MLQNSYAAQGRQLPARRITSAPAPVPTINNQLSPPSTKNLAGWIVPHAQIRWLGPGVAWYSPQRVEQIWRQAIAGDLASSWEMFDLMESTWPCLSKCLNQLKDAVVSQGIRVLPFTPKNAQPTPEAIARAAFVDTAIHGMIANPSRDENDLEDTIRDLMDARGKGISILEVDWTISTSAFSLQPSAFPAAVLPRCTRWVHPAWYGYPYGPGSGLLQLRAPVQNHQLSTQKSINSGGAPVAPGDTSQAYGYSQSATWMDFPEHKFLIGVCKNKTGHPLGSALLHQLAFWWAASNFTAEWFLNFCQVFGQPFRWATYDPNMTPDDQQKLQTMLTMMGSSAWGMFPQGTTFELKDVAAKAGDNIQLALMALADKQCTQLILRQSLTSDVDGSGSRALGEVHERVLGGVEESLGKWICKTLDQLVRSICLLNFNTDTECPTLVCGMDEEASPEELGKLLVDVKNAGLQPTDEALPDLGERLGFPVERQALPPAMPGFGDTNAEPKDKAGEQDQEKDQDQEQEEKSESVTADSPSSIHNSSFLIHTSPSTHAALAKAYAGSMAPFRQIIIAAASRDECIMKLARAYADWKPERLAHELDSALQICSATAAANSSTSA